MSFAYLALFTGDYLRDTRHLTPLKHGIYLLLLMHCWDQKGPLPLDEQECAGIANCRSADEIDSLRYVLNKYFVKLEDGWYNNRMNREIEKAENISGIRSKAGKLGYKARAKQMLSKSQASAKLLHLSPSPSPSLSLPPSPEVNTLSGKPDDAYEILKFLNNATGRNYRFVATNLTPIRARLKTCSVDEVKRVIASKCNEWRGDPDMDAYLRPKTLFAATNFENYLGAVDGKV